MGKVEDLITAKKAENNKIIERRNVHFDIIKGALPRSSNNKEDCWK